MARSRPEKKPEAATPELQDLREDAPPTTGIMVEPLPGDGVLGTDGNLYRDGAVVLPPLAPVDPVLQAPRPPEFLEPPAAPLARYRVLETHRIMHRGSITFLKAGKLVDDGNYRIDDLVEQGVRLERVRDDGEV